MFVDYEKLFMDFANFQEHGIAKLAYILYQPISLTPSLTLIYFYGNKGMHYISTDLCG